MHEMAITRSVIEIVESEAEKEKFRRVLEISLCVGEYSGLVPQCIEAFFPIAAAGSKAEGAALSIKPVKAKFKCLDCGYEGDADRANYCCRNCGGTALKMTAGREFYVENLKVE